MAATAEQVHDLAHFREMTGDDPALQGEIVLLFRGQTLLWRKLLIADAPVHTWRDAVHTLKGSARGIGLWRLAAACEAAELATRGCAPEAAEIVVALGRVRTALEEALAALPDAAPAPPLQNCTPSPGADGGGAGRRSRISPRRA